MIRISSKFFYFTFFLSIMYGQGFWGSAFPEQKLEYNPRTYVCYKASGKIIMDGKLDDIDWEKSAWTESFVDIEGSLKPDPFLDTKAKMLWDDTYFYFGAEMEEPHVWATLTERDAVIFKDNDFEIFLDPDGDTHNYYELEVNALATEWDLILLKPYHDDSKVALDSWDIPGLITKVNIDGTINNPYDQDKGWSVEIAIPWKSLIGNYRSNNHPKDGEQWKVNFSRVHWETDIADGSYIKKDKSEYNWVWSPQGLIYMHMPDLWGIVQFTNQSPGRKKVKYKESKVDQIKWALRQVYYRQRNHYFKNEKYTDSIQLLNLITAPREDIPWPPEIVLTHSGWEAILVWNDQKVIIRKDGKVWVK